MSTITLTLPSRAIKVRANLLFGTGTQQQNAAATLASKNMTPRAAAENEVIALLGERLRPYFPETVVDHPSIWVGMLFQRLREAIGTGDRVAISLACDLIEKDPHLPFWKLIKSGLSRQLRKSPQLLVASERAQVVNTTLRLLALPYAPRELEDYAKLVSKLPRNEYVEQLALVEPKNEKCVRLKEYLLVENSECRLPALGTRP